MSSVWIRLSLLYLLQHSVSSDEGVSLICPKTISVTSNETIEKKCSVEWKSKRDCEGVKASLTHSNVTTTCGENDSETYSCAWVTNSTVTLTIFEVKEEIITVDIQSSCGLASHDIHVQVSDKMAPPDSKPWIDEEEPQLYLIPSILGVLATVVAVAILSCLIRKYITSKNNQGHTNVSQEDV